MNFKRGRHREEPEINFIAMIDVMMVILIFLMVTTTYNRFTELQINLPQADGQQSTEKPKEIQVAVDSHGKYLINNTVVSFINADQFSTELRRAAGDVTDPVVVINADQQATHQSVVNIMESARQAGLGRITFATQAAKSK